MWLANRIFCLGCGEGSTPRHWNKHHHAYIYIYVCMYVCMYHSPPRSSPVAHQYLEILKSTNPEQAFEDPTQLSRGSKIAHQQSLPLLQALGVSAMSDSAHAVCPLSIEPNVHSEHLQHWLAEVSRAC